nr:MAG TPA: hypothetical protein [Bacteriophage sp.]
MSVFVNIFNCSSYGKLTNINYQYRCCIYRK